MADDNLGELYKTQKSLTEWLEDIKHKDTEAIRIEDNTKPQRLSVLNDIINLPFERPTQFEATDLMAGTPKFKQFLEGHARELCGLRLLPKKDGLPKLRTRGNTVAASYEWAKQQSIDPSQYLANFTPHTESELATIFIVNQHGIQGEIIRGGHHQLTQGFHRSTRPSTFRYDFTTWSIDTPDKELLDYLKGLASYLLVPEPQKQTQLSESLGATFAHDYLEGYFETTFSSSIGTWFIDYNRPLGKLYSDAIVRVNTNTHAVISGQTGCEGVASGPVCIVSPDGIAEDFPEGAILVCSVTTPDYVPLMQKAAAIVTDQGGILSHAAIVARELKKPCIVGTGNASSVLADRQQVQVDAGKGIVTIL